NSRLYKQSPPTRTKKNQNLIEPTQVGFAYVDAVSNRPFKIQNNSIWLCGILVVEIMEME
ncbi:MAG: hypothetical protein ACKPEQ_09220, partial [Dolichospermum sp.]